MGGGARLGFSLVEALLAVAVLGLSLGGLSSLISATLAQEGEAMRRMAARHLAAAALEPGDGPAVPGPFHLRVTVAGGRREARVRWREPGGPREVRFGVWTGDE